jgi:hypothetical protein
MINLKNANMLLTDIEIMDRTAEIIGTLDNQDEFDFEIQFVAKILGYDVGIVKGYLRVRLTGK